jgi:hypothetical protein
MMKAISIKQPWAELIGQGVKTIEVRSWQTKYRGPLLIVSSLNPFEGLKKFKETDSEGRHKVEDELFDDLKFLHFGRAICICELYEIEPFARKHEKGAHLASGWGDSFAWCLRNIQPVKPVPIKGKLNFFEVEDYKIVVL